MARKVLNRKELRAQSEAAEKAAPKKKAAKKKTATRKSRSKKKAPEDIQRKAFWGVFNQTLKRVALYEYSQKKQAQAKAKELSKSSKSPHFVQKVKEEMAE